MMFNEYEVQQMMEDQKNEMKKREVYDDVKRKRGTTNYQQSSPIVKRSALRFKRLWSTKYNNM